MNAIATSPLELLGTPTTLVVVVQDHEGNEILRPIYECHTWSKVAEFVNFYQGHELTKVAEIQVWEYSKHLASLFVNFVNK